MDIIIFSFFFSLTDIGQFYLPLGIKYIFLNSKPSSCSFSLQENNRFQAEATCCHWVLYEGKVRAVFPLEECYGESYRLFMEMMTVTRTMCPNWWRILKKEKQLWRQTTQRKIINCCHWYKSLRCGQINLYEVMSPKLRVESQSSCSRLWSNVLQNIVAAF